MNGKSHQYTQVGDVFVGSHCLFVEFIWKDHVRVHFAQPCNWTKHNHRNQKWRRYRIAWPTKMAAYMIRRIKPPIRQYFKRKSQTMNTNVFYILIGGICFSHSDVWMKCLPLLWVYCLHLDCAIDVTRGRLYDAQRHTAFKNHLNDRGQAIMPMKLFEWSIVVFASLNGHCLHSRMKFKLSFVEKLI